MDIRQLELQSEINRKRLVEIVYNAQAGHIGGDLSCLNILTVLYFKEMRVFPDKPNEPTRDRFVMSKGHSAEALFTILEAKGFIDKSTVDLLGKYGSPLAGHPTNDIPGVEVNTGALGHGLSVGVGIALAAKMNSDTYKTFVLMGDGEQAEGSIYEAAMAAHQYRLDNLVAMIDHNGLQISGETVDVMDLLDIRARWESFGWEVLEMDGDSIESIVNTFELINYTNKRPHLIIANTTKGKGVSYMENVAEWHHKVPNEALYKKAIEEISERIKKIED